MSNRDNVIELHPHTMRAANEDQAPEANEPSGAVLVDNAHQEGNWAKKLGGGATTVIAYFAHTVFITFRTPVMFFLKLFRGLSVLSGLVFGFLGSGQEGHTEGTALLIGIAVGLTLIIMAYEAIIRVTQQRIAR